MSDVIELQTAAEVTASVIWLHGLGADGNDFVPVVPALSLGQLGVRFLFPNAPVRPVTINGGMAMRAWYDILSMGASREVDEAQLIASADRIDGLIEAEQARGIAPQRIFLVGFSQGGAVAYHCALRRQAPLAGLALMSTYRVAPERYPRVAAGTNLPVFWSHGLYDDVVPKALAETGLTSLQQEGLTPQAHRYPMGHEVCLPQLSDLSRWMLSSLAPQPGALP